MRALAILSLLAVAACGATVAPYQRGYLARPDMAFDASPGPTRAMEKTFGAKESSSGGATVGGGGCGCS